MNETDFLGRSFKVLQTLIAEVSLDITIDFQLREPNHSDHIGPYN